MKTKAAVFLLAAAVFNVSGLGLQNLALNKPTKQSSTEDGISSDGISSDRAVDGNNNTNVRSGSCSHVSPVYGPSNDWWQVDLLKIFNVISVSVTNRGDCCHERLTNFTVEVHTSDPMTSNNSGFQLCYWHENTVGNGSTVDLPCAVNTVGRYVRIVKYSSYCMPLTLCEVEVRGSPVHRTCGDSPFGFGFSRHSTGARDPHYIIASHENTRKLDCAFMCLGKATCNAFNSRSPSMGVVSCELLATALDPIKNASWGVYTINIDTFSSK